jgi:hypothetical protein
MCVENSKEENPDEPRKAEHNDDVHKPGSRAEKVDKMRRASQESQIKSNATSARAIQQWLHSRETAPKDVVRKAEELTGYNSPWPTHMCYAAHNNDATTYTMEVEQASFDQFASPYLPAFSVHAARLSESGSKLNPDNWDRLFQHHPQRAWLTAGARYGFPLCSVMTPTRKEHKNHHEWSTREAAAISEWVKKQQATGKVIDVSNVVADMPALVVSPFSIVPKEDGGYRVCHNASAGKESSVNAHIDLTPLDPLELASIHKIITRIRYLAETEPTTEIFGAKLDLAAYFRQIKIRPREWWMTGQSHDKATFLHTVLSFGIKSAGHTGGGISNAIRDLFTNAKHWVTVFQDDYFILGTKEEVAAAIRHIRNILRQLGLAENEEKFVPPQQMITVLGVLFNLATKTASITNERREKISERLRVHLAAKEGTITVGEARALAGTLAFVGAIVPLAGAHTAALWRLAGDSTSDSSETRTIDIFAKEAMQWWSEVLAGTRFATGPVDVGIATPLPTIITGISTDASGSGMGGVSLQHKVYMQGKWYRRELKWSITVKEAMAALLFLMGIAPLLTGQIVILQIDNLPVAYMILTLTAKTPRLRLIALWFACLQETYRFQLLPSHITTKQNPSDGISRGKNPRKCLPHNGTDRWKDIPMPDNRGRLGWLVSAQLPVPQSQAAEKQQLASTTTIDLRSYLKKTCWDQKKIQRTTMTYVPQIAWELRLRQLAHVAGSTICQAVV